MFDDEPEYDVIDKCKHTSETIIIPDMSLVFPEILPISVDNLGNCVLEWHSNANEQFTDQFQASYEITKLM